MTKSRFREARLYDAGGDVKKQWFVFWTGLDARVNKVRRMRIVLPLKLSASERYSEGQRVIHAVNDAARVNGGVFYKGAAAMVTPGKSRELLTDALREAMAIKAKQCAVRTMSSYAVAVNMLLRWLQEQGLGNMVAADFSKMLAQRYLNAMQRERGLANKTINNMQRFLHACFIPVVKNGTLAVNPLSGIEGLRETVGDAHPPYTAAQRDAMKRIYAQQFPQLGVLAAFVYYLLLRPVEAFRLQARHLDFVQRKVRIPAASSKTDVVRHPRMSRVFYDYLIGLGYDKLPGKWFLFGDDLRPAAVVTTDEIQRRRLMNVLQNSAVKLLEAEGVAIDEKQRMYSWKSTGAMDLFKSGVKLKYIQQQCGHTSVRTTEIYLKHLGAMDEDYEREMDEKQGAM